MRDELHDQRRDKIVAAARRVFLDKGFERATINEAARLARVSSATVYIYFETKDRLFEAVTAAALAPFQDVFAQAEGLTGDPEAVLTRMARAYFDFLTDPGVRGLYRIVIGEADRRPDLGESVYGTAHNTLGAVLRRRLARFDAEGVLKAPDPAMAARLFQGMIEHTTLIIPLIRGLATPPLHEADPYCAEVVRAFLSAYRPTGELSQA
jgi:AcrR family transcriptional regulator